MNALWKPAAGMTPDYEPVLCGFEHRVIYRGLMVEPQIDWEMGRPLRQRWRVLLAASNRLMFTVSGKKERAVEIAMRLADAKDWTQVSGAMSCKDLPFDPLILRLMQDYPRTIGLAIDEPDNDWEDLVPYGDS